MKQRNYSPRYGRYIFYGDDEGDDVWEYFSDD